MSVRSVEELLGCLVAIPSVNPAHSGDDNITGEKRVAAFAADYLAALGFRIEWHGSEPGRPNLIATCGSDDPVYSLLMEAHLDTVGVEGMTIDPFGAEISNGRLWGRGASDTKGPLAAALWAVDTDLVHAMESAGCRLMIVGAMGEETGNEGAHQLVKHGIRADEAIILEPTDLQLIHTHKGALWFTIEVQGLPAHASNPEQGLSAVTAMQEVITFLQKQIEDDAVRLKDTVLGRPTLNIGVIKGGVAVNIVPEKCSIDIDRRTLPDEVSHDIMQRIENGLKQLRTTGVVKDYRLHIIKDAPAFATRPNGALIRRLLESCEAEGVEARPVGASWHSDASAFSQVCGQTVVFGPGSIKQAHTRDEYIEIDALQKGAACLRRFLRAAVEQVKG